MRMQSLIVILNFFHNLATQLIRLHQELTKMNTFIQNLQRFVTFIVVISINVFLKFFRATRADFMLNIYVVRAFKAPAFLFFFF